MAINVNTASIEDILTISDMTPTLAKDIIAHRPYRSFADLNNVPGIEPVQLERFREEGLVVEPVLEINQTNVETPAIGDNIPVLTGSAADSIVDVNTALREDLLALDGMTEDIAAAILAKRPFLHIADLLELDNMSSDVLSQLQDQGLAVLHEHVPLASESIEPPSLAELLAPQKSESGVAPDRTSELTPFTTLQKPAANSIIEFTEVLGYPIDKLLSRLYVNVPSNDDVSMSEGNKQSQRFFTLDFRPNRWYRDYQHIQTELVWANENLNTAKVRLEMAMAQKRQEAENFDEGVYEYRAAKLADAQDKYRFAYDTVTVLEAKRVSIEREIKTAGYRIMIADTPVDGYAFSIARVAEEEPDDEILTLSPATDLGNDNEWNALTERLMELVKNSTTLTNADKTEFKRRKQELDQPGELSEVANVLKNSDLIIENYKEVLKNLPAQRENALATLESQRRAEIARLKEMTCGACAHNADTEIIQINADFDKKITRIKMLHDTKRSDVLGSITAEEINRAKLKKDMICRLRTDFHAVWSGRLKGGKYVEKAVKPNSDPLTDLLVDYEKQNGKDSAGLKMFFLRLTPRGFLTDDGLTPEDVIRKAALNSASDTLVILPTFDRQRRLSEELFLAVLNPHPSVKAASYPTLRFVETYLLEIGWRGFGLGELSHTFNLLPGETKELIIEKQTKLATKVARTTKEEEGTTRKLTSSFEDNMQSNLSTQLKATTARENSNATTYARQEAVDVSAGAAVSTSISGGCSFIQGSFSASAHFDYKKSRAMSSNNNTQAKTATNQSREKISNDLRNMVSKTASETSVNNKIEMSVSSTEERESKFSEKETVTISNPNVGRTVNYNFFQVQNLYQTSARLIDVQIILDTGREIIAGSGARQIMTFDLEDLGKIFSANDLTDRRTLLLAAIVARGVLEFYTDIEGVSTGSEALAMEPGFVYDKKLLRALVLNDPAPGGIKDGDGLNWDNEDFTLIRSALSYLQSIPFQFRGAELLEPTVEAVNSGGCYVDSEVGRQPATEKYLEKRRDIETDRQKARVEHLRAQTAEKVFFPEKGGQDGEGAAVSGKVYGGAVEDVSADSAK